MGGCEAIGGSCTIQFAPVDSAVLASRSARTLGLKNSGELCVMQNGKPKLSARDTLILTNKGRDALVKYLEDYHLEGSSLTNNSDIDELTGLVMDDEKLLAAMQRIESEVGAGPLANK